MPGPAQNAKQLYNCIQKYNIKLLITLQMHIIVVSAKE